MDTLRCLERDRYMGLNTGVREMGLIEDVEYGFS